MPTASLTPQPTGKEHGYKINAKLNQTDSEAELFICLVQMSTN